MSGPSIIFFAMGALIMISRGPLILWPAQTREVYNRMIDSSLAIRGIGLFVAIMGVGSFLAGWNPTQLADYVVLGLGCLFTAGAILIIISTKAYQFIARSFLEGTDDFVLRMLGVVSILFAAGLFWAGIANM